MNPQHKMPDGTMMSGASMHSTSMKQHQQQACADCTPKENAQKTAANKPPVHTHPAHHINTIKY